MPLEYDSDRNYPETKASLAAFVGSSLLCAGPVLLYKYLPLVDLPNHIARHFIAASPPGPLDAYYEYNLELVPNSAVDLLWLGLGNGADPVRFSQISIAFSIIALIGSTMALGRIVSGHWSPWPAAVGLVSYNANFFWGFQNYIFSIPFAILSLGIWLWSEKFTPRIRLSIFLPLVPILYLMHFFAFAALAIGVFGREIQRLIESRSTWRIVLLESALLSIPFVIPLLWLVIQTLYSEPSPSGTHTEFGPWFRRIEVISSPVSLVTELGISKALTISSFAIFCTLLFLIGSLAINTVGKLDVVKEMRGPLAALSVAALLAPSWLNGVAFVHHRLPVIALAAFFASSKWRLRSTKAYGLFWMFLTVMLIGRAVAFARFADQHSNETLDFLAVVEEVPSGSRLLPVRATNSAMETRLWHLAGYAVMSREVFVPTLFQGVHALSVREEWSKFATPAFHAVSAAWLQPIEGEYPRLLRFVKDWDTKFTHLIMLNSELTDLENLEQLKVLRNRGRFTLFQIQHYENAMQ